jgi:hypothetical protein
MVNDQLVHRKNFAKNVVKELRVATENGGAFKRRLSSHAADLGVEQNSGTIAHGSPPVSQHVATSRKLPLAASL